MSQIAKNFVNHPVFGVTKSKEYSKIHYDSHALNASLSKIKKYRESMPAVNAVMDISFKMKAYSIGNFNNAFQTADENRGIRLELSYPATASVVVSNRSAQYGFNIVALTSALEFNKDYAANISLDQEHLLRVVCDGKLIFEGRDKNIDAIVQDIAVGTGVSRSRPFDGAITDFSLRYGLVNRIVPVSFIFAIIVLIISILFLIFFLLKALDLLSLIIRFRLFLSGLLIVILWGSPIILAAGKTGVFDWGVAMQRFEAFRLTIFQYHQWPGLNPWVEGGQPLVSNPGLTIFSPEGFLVLLCGTFWGLRISVLAYLIVGFLGAWKLAKVFWQEEFFSFIFALYTVANPSVAYHIAAGHLCFLNFWFMPWALYYLLRIKDDKWSGLKAGIVCGLAFVSCAMYVVQDAALIFAGLFIWFWLKSKKEDSRAFVNWIILFLPAFGTLVAYRLVAILYTARDFSRITNWPVHFDLGSLLQYYFYPFTGLSVVKNIGGVTLTTWELCCYLGSVSVILLGISLKKGLRWWHVTWAMLIWAMAGNDSIYYLMYWIRKLPFFSSQLCFMRIMMFIPLFLGICAVWGLNYLWPAGNKKKFVCYLIILLAIVMVGEVMSVSHRILKSAQVPCVYSNEYNVDRKFRNISRIHGSPFSPTTNFAYNSTRMNLGWLRGEGDPYIPGNNIRIGLDEPGYIGEYYQGRAVVEPIYWSPNRIVFQKLKKDIPLTLNMNPSKAWYNNGAQLFPHYKIVEPHRPFEVMSDSNGRVDLRYIYPGQKIGLSLTLLFFIFTIITIRMNVNKKNA